MLEWGVDDEGNEGYITYESKGCDKCGHTGFVGRVPLIEIIIFDNYLRDYFAQTHGLIEIEKYLRKNINFRSLWDKGMVHVADGSIALEELLDTIEPDVDIALDDVPVVSAKARHITEVINSELALDSKTEPNVMDPASGTQEPEVQKTEIKQQKKIVEAVSVDKFDVNAEAGKESLAETELVKEKSGLENMKSEQETVVPESGTEKAEVQEPDMGQQKKLGGIIFVGASEGKPETEPVEENQGQKEPVLGILMQPSSQSKDGDK